MIVAELIAELQGYNQHIEVRSALTIVQRVGSFIAPDVSVGEGSARVVGVRFEGNHVLLEVEG